MAGPAPAAECLLIPAVPLFLRPQHRLLVGGAHDDAIFVGKPGIQRIVFIEGVVPHRRPEIVAFQPEYHFE